MKRHGNKIFIKGIITTLTLFALTNYAHPKTNVGIPRSPWPTTSSMTEEKLKKQKIRLIKKRHRKERREQRKKQRIARKTLRKEHRLERRKTKENLKQGKLPPAEQNNLLKKITARQKMERNALQEKQKHDRKNLKEKQKHEIAAI